jgi:signal peptidase I
MAKEPGANPGTEAEQAQDGAEPSQDALGDRHSQEEQPQGEQHPQGEHDTEQDAQEEQDGEASAPKKRKRSFWRDLAVIVVAALALTIVLKAFVVQVFSIPSGSMENTLQPGDRILVNKFVYRLRSIDRGDIVVFSGAGSWDPPNPPPGNVFSQIWHDVTGLVGIAAPGTDYIKRVIGIPGDHVVCCDAQGRVTVNRVPLTEHSYIFPGDAPSTIPFNITVPPGRLWVMGDNRGDSDDSRFRRTFPGGGTIPQSAVVGRAFVIIWPFSRINDLPIPNTFEQAAFSAAAAVSAAPPAAAGGGSAVLAGAVLAWRRRKPGASRRKDGRRNAPGRP